MPAYERVVGSKPPFEYESAKIAAATAIPTAASRATTACSIFTLASGKASYSNGHVRGAEPAPGIRRRGRCRTRAAAGRDWPTAAASRRRSTSTRSAWLRRRRKAHERLPSHGRDADRRIDGRVDGLDARPDLEADGEEAQEGRHGRADSWRISSRATGSAPPAVEQLDSGDGADGRRVGLRPRLGPDRSPHRARRHRRSSCSPLPGTAACGSGAASSSTRSSTARTGLRSARGRRPSPRTSGHGAPSSARSRFVGVQRCRRHRSGPPDRSEGRRARRRCARPRARRGCLPPPRRAAAARRRDRSAPSRAPRRRRRRARAARRGRPRTRGPRAAARTAGTGRSRAPARRAPSRASQSAPGPSETTATTDSLAPAQRASSSSRLGSCLKPSVPE